MDRTLTFVNSSRKGKSKKPNKKANKTSNTGKHSASKEECICGQNTAPLEVLTQIEGTSDAKSDSWIQCDFCDSWWHSACAGITAQAVDAMCSLASKYKCPKCIVNPSLSKTKQEKHSAQSASKNPESALHSPEKDSAPDLNRSDTNTVFPKHDPNADNIVIIDGCFKQELIGDSRQIKKEILKVKPSLSVHHAYSLPGGGISLHCKSQTDKEIALSEWPETSFGSQSVIHAHTPSRHSPVDTVVVKSVPLHLKTEVIKREIDINHNSDVRVTRLKNYRKGVPFPIIKVQKNPNTAQKFVSEGIRFNGKLHRCQPKSTTKVIRCFKCQSFGHTSQLCRNTARCCNCGGSGCDPSSGCSKPSQCSNCGGNHPADHKSCPTYLEIKGKLHERSITYAGACSHIGKYEDPTTQH